MASYIFCEQCIRKKSEKITGNTEDVHKKICISSFLFYNFALIYILGIFLLQRNGVFYCKYCRKQTGEGAGIIVSDMHKTI